MYTILLIVLYSIVLHYIALYSIVLYCICWVTINLFLFLSNIDNLSLTQFIALSCKFFFQICILTRIMICFAKPWSHPGWEQMKSVPNWPMHECDNHSKFVCYLWDHICCGHIFWPFRRPSSDDLFAIIYACLQLLYHWMTLSYDYMILSYEYMRLPCNLMRLLYACLWLLYCYLVT